ncbi:hypothetical protein [Burkholderia sp. IMCC1007]|uniref:hypothetical protein n=1 Tax=Burkholderia sp. IMCC1007 TaxID=3004104 RepID=UPI0022B3D7EE|nr:hypothetical protein [Burkholderia sp. IMCC1007]
MPEFGGAHALRCCMRHGYAYDAYREPPAFLSPGTDANRAKRRADARSGRAHVRVHRDASTIVVRLRERRRAAGDPCRVVAAGRMIDARYIVDAIMLATSQVYATHGSRVVHIPAQHNHERAVPMRR